MKTTNTTRLSRTEHSISLIITIEAGPSAGDSAQSFKIESSSHIPIAVVLRDVSAFKTPPIYDDRKSENVYSVNTTEHDELNGLCALMITLPITTVTLNFSSSHN